MVIQNIVDPPPLFILPLSKGGDLIVTFVYMDIVTDEDGEPILDDNGEEQFAAADYPDGSTVVLTIEHAEGDIEAIAVITGSEASIVVDKEKVNPVKNKSLWRVIMTDIDGLDIPFCNGIVTRFDGKPPLS